MHEGFRADCPDGLLRFDQGRKIRCEGGVPDMRGVVLVNDLECPGGLLLEPVNVDLESVAVDLDFLGQAGVDYDWFVFHDRGSFDAVSSTVENLPKPPAFCTGFLAPPSP